MDATEKQRAAQGAGDIDARDGVEPAAAEPALMGPSFSRSSLAIG